MKPSEEFILHEQCAPRRILQLFATKWPSMVLYALHHRTFRTGELQRALPGISKKMLTQTLRDLEQAELIERKVYREVPPKVEYSLTPVGQVFIEPIEMLYEWGRQHEAELSRLNWYDR